MIGSEIGSTILRGGILQDRLEDAYSDASLYLDIMLHDIKNANAAVRGGYSQRLMDYTREGGATGTPPKSGGIPIISRIFSTM
ncbi:hypothetical protein [Methanogenium cariaci]|uniref:hypothetical protein n=1 Tax=Methanogenium cariaci TaxID=2197 RepID=UPI0007831018|nr:hypothetical protein [Methanogenium cariaci]